MNINRRYIFDIVEKDTTNNTASKTYDVVMMLAIVASVVPLMFREQTLLFWWIEHITVGLFMADYVVRLATADYLIGKGWKSFVCYPFRFFAIIDLLSILPSFNLLGQGFRAIRLARLMKIVRIFRFVRYSDQIKVLVAVLRKERRLLLSVLVFALFYVFATALVMFNSEPAVNPDTGEVAFRNFFDALYWSTVTLTTVGYGDICPTTDIGRFVSMMSSVFGIAIIALPSGIITAGYMNELRKSE